MTTKISPAIIEELSIAINTPVDLKQVIRIYGGDINQTFHLVTTAGEFFIKMNSDAATDMFEKEMNGLKLLQSVNAIKTPEPVVHGKEAEAGFLIMEFIEKGDPNKNFWKTFAEGLALQHQCTNKSFGLCENNYMGSLNQSNRNHTSCADFYAEERIMPLMQHALSKGRCDTNDMKLAEQLCKKLAGIIPYEKPALLHGDLWSGNFMIDKNGLPVIMDPAVYYGHREADIGMTLLFGGFSSELYHYYNEIFPLEKSWKQRLELWQLYPLLVHLILFGSSYYHRVKQVLIRYR